MLSLQDDILPVTTVVVAVGVAVVEVSGEVADGSLSVGRLESTGGRRANECSDDGSDTEPAGGGGECGRRIVATAHRPAPLGFSASCTSVVACRG